MYVPAVAASASSAATIVSPGPPFSLTRWLNDPPLNAVLILITILLA